MTSTRLEAAASQPVLEMILANGVRRAGAEQGLVTAPVLLERLKTTSFYLDEALVNAVFEPWLKPFNGAAKSRAKLA